MTAKLRLYLPDGLAKRADADVSDLTGCKRVGEQYWEPGDVLVVPMDKMPPAAERAAIRRRMVTADAADERRLLKLLQARALTGDPGAAARAKARDLFEELWLETELAKYGEPAAS